MRTRRLAASSLVALLASLLVLATPRPATADEEAVAEVADAAEASPDGTVQVLVQLDVSADPEGELSRRAAARQRDEIDDSAGEALADIDDGTVEGVEVFETIPYIAMDVDARAVEELAASGAVSDIVIDRRAEPTLDSSLGVVQGDVTNGIGYDGTGFNVAVVDTGVDLAHEFLTGKISATQACFAKGSNGSTAGGACANGQDSQTGAGAGAACTFTVPTGECRHGTHVAGIAAGLRSGTNPTHGVADGAGIVPVQVFSDVAGSTSSASAYFSDILLALQWLDTNKGSLSLASVNMSLGDSSEYAIACDGVDATANAFKLVIDSLRASGIATVVAAGNAGNDAGLSFPACLSSVISVGSVSDAGVVSSFSNRASYLSLYAPGEAIRSSVLDSNGDGVHNDYTNLQGTSMAAPHVAGAWAVLRQVRTAAGFPPDVTAELDALRASGPVIGGVPRLALYDALQPAAPTGVAAGAGNGDATVFWTAPAWTGAGPVTGYQVNSWPTTDPSRVTSTLVGAVTSTVIPGLATPGDFSFSVQALNGLNDPGAASPAVIAATAPAAPTAVSASVSSSSALVTWTAPVSNGGAALTDYRVTVSPADGVASPTQSVGFAATGMSFTGLTNGQTYTFTVTALNAVGESVPSAPSNPVTPQSSTRSGGGGGGGGGGGSGTTTTTTRPRTTTTTTTPAPTSPAPPPDEVASPGASIGDGSVVTVRGGDAVVISRAAPAGVTVVAGAVTPSGGGAWSVASNGQVFTTGDAPDLGDLAGASLNAPVVGITPTPTGRGYWLLGRDGGIFSFGDAAFFGSTGGTRLNQPVVGMASTASGHGYWLFAGDGGIFTFGDARFFGSTGALRLNGPVTTMAPTPTGRGYWLLGSDGGVFTFGDAAFHGSTGGRTDVGAIEAIVPTESGGGYWLIGNDGRLHPFGDAA